MRVSPEPGLVRAGGYALSGLLVWTVHFVFIYGFVGLACARPWGTAAALGVGLVPLVVGLATLLAAAAIPAILVLGRLRGDGANRFLDRLALAIGLLALLAVIWEGAAILVVPACQ